MFCYLIVEFFYLIAMFCYLIVEFCYLIAMFCYLIVEFFYLIAMFCYLVEISIDILGMFSMINTYRLIVIIGSSDYFTVIYGLNITDWVIIMRFYNNIDIIDRLIVNF